MVPMGIAFFGLAKSPDMDTPASNPCTAGKKMANSAIHGSEFTAEPLRGVLGTNSCCPSKIEAMESTMIPRIKNCVLSARFVLINETIVTTRRVIAPVNRIVFSVTSSPKAVSRVSENPII